MKKLFTLITVLFISFTSFAQFESTEISTGSFANPPATVRIETYQANYGYFHDEANEITQVYSVGISGEQDTMYNHPHYLTRKYAGYTPGQLIERSGYLKNVALSVGLAGTFGGAFMCAIPFFNGKFTGDAADWVCIGTGCGVAFGCGVAAIALSYTANRLMQEAGLKMQRIQFTGNGLTVKF